MCVRVRESQRERVERNTREREEEKEAFAFFLIFISPILNFSKGGVLKGKTKKKIARSQVITLIVTKNAFAIRHQT